MNIAIIAAAGKSMRMKGIDKIETIVCGKPLILHTLAPFLASKKIDHIIITCNSENKKRLQKIFSAKKFSNIYLVLGGESRFDSVKNGFLYAEKNFKLSPDSTILFHNSGNVLVTQEEIETSMQLAKTSGACIIARPVSDTLKKINDKNLITRSEDRSSMLHAETPQTFRYDILKKAYNKAEKDHMEFTDEAQLIEHLGLPVSWTLASTFNRKITTQHDLEYTKYLIEKTGAQRLVYGLGTDTHLFDKSSKKSLTLCGIKIPGIQKLSGNSDADVALHALTAAISQAIGGGSLGTFSDSLCKKGVTDSAKYLDHILVKAKEKHTRITHIGLNFECKKPKIDPLAPRLRKSLAKLLNLPITEIGITATTGENTTPSARGEGIYCMAIVTVDIST